jgi:hypothetical protein
MLQLAGLLQSSQRAEHRIEEKEQNEDTVLIEMQLPVASPVTLAADVVQTIQ